MFKPTDYCCCQPQLLMETNFFFTVGLLQRQPVKLIKIMTCCGTVAKAQPNTEKMMRHLHHSQQGSGNIIKEEKVPEKGVKCFLVCSSYVKHFFLEGEGGPSPGLWQQWRGQGMVHSPVETVSTEAPAPGTQLSGVIVHFRLCFLVT